MGHGHSSVEYSPIGQNTDKANTTVVPHFVATVLRAFTDFIKDGLKLSIHIQIAQRTHFI